jgi:hypothetical protein
MNQVQAKQGIYRMPPVTGFGVACGLTVVDVEQACCALWRSRGTVFITAPMDKCGDICCYSRSPDSYIIEVGQSKPSFAYG